MSKDEKLNNGIKLRGKTYSYVLRVPDPTTGKTKPKWVGGFLTIKEAKAARDKARVLLSTRDYIAPTKITLGEFLDRWIEIHERNLRLTTSESYRLAVRRIKAIIGDIKLQDVKPSHVEKLYAALQSEGAHRLGGGLSARTAEYVGTVLKKALRYAVETEGLLTFNPVSRVARPKGVPASFNPWSFEELNQFLQVAKTHRLGFYFHLSAFTGARRGELNALRWSDFDGHAITISKNRVMAYGKHVELNTTKGGKNGQRRVPLDPETCALFREHRKRQLLERMALGEAWQDTGYIFTREDGLPIFYSSITDLFNRLTIKAGLRHTRLHDLRHLHATELLRKRVPLHQVADRLGHRDAMVTATIYAHVSSEDADELALFSLRQASNDR